MNIPRLLVALCALLFSALAGAQLTLPRSGKSNSLTLPAAAAPAPAPASTPEAPAAPAPNSKEAAGQLAAAGWLLLLDVGDWGSAWDNSSQVFHTTVPLAQWMDGIPKLRKPFGTFVSRTPTGAVYKTTLQGKPDGDYVTATFTSDFTERKGVQEIVTTVREADGRWRVTGYSTR
jgi:hypothetical protein